MTIETKHLDNRSLTSPGALLVTPAELHFSAVRGGLALTCVCVSVCVFMFVVHKPAKGYTWPNGFCIQVQSDKLVDA